MASARRVRDEFGIIADIFAPLAANSPGAFGLTDDAAAVALDAGQELIVTKDVLVAGVHFLAEDNAADVARKLLRVNLSDLAAMGAAPVGYLLAAALPREIDEGWLTSFADGLREDQDEYGVGLLGGDTVSTDGPLTLSLTALGELPAGAALRRAGATAGDAVYVSGTLGDGALGLRLVRGELGHLDAEHQAFLAERYHLPEPRLELGQRLRGLAHAAIDISDGLAADLAHICQVSGCGAEVEATRVPLSEPARAAVASAPELFKEALTGGDDYELLFTVAPEAEGAVAALADEIALPLTRIGRITGSGGLRILDAGGAPLDLGEAGYRHF
ncbi:MAG: thiamine-phosphate kinase [Kiloniellales bacterium]